MRGMTRKEFNDMFNERLPHRLTTRRGTLTYENFDKLYQQEKRYVFPPKHKFSQLR